MRAILVVLISFTLLTPVLADDAAQPSGKQYKGLMVIGGCCHDYGFQGAHLAQAISKSVNIKWTIVPQKFSKKRDARVDIYEKDDWAEGYDVVVHNECYGGVKDPAYVKRIAKPHHDGVPGVVIHCSMHSYRASPAADQWRAFLGVKTTSHERHRPLEVKNLKPDHTIMKGFPTSWKTPNGELYKIEKLGPNCVPLGKAYGKDTKKDHVCIWTNTYGKGRVFGTTLGHHNETMKTPEYIGLVTRGTMWAMGLLGERE